MKLLNRAFLILSLVAIPAFVLLSHQAYGQIPTGPSCESFDDCPLGYGDCAPDPNGGSDLVCIPMFCGSDSDCLTNMCDVGVCTIPTDGPSVDPPGVIINTVLVSANDPETGACEIGEVDVDTGEYSKKFDAGCNECGGIDTDDNGNLLVACAVDGPVETDAITRNGLAVGRIVELHGRTGNLLSSNTHGVSNYISDIAILPSSTLLSHETNDEDTVHEHDQMDSYLANPIGPTGLNVENAGLTAPLDRMYRTLAANVDGVPALYDIDPETGKAMFNIALQLPPNILTANTSTRAVALKDIQIQAIDYLRPIAVINPDPIAASDLSIRAGLVPIEDADYVVLMTKDDPMTGAQDNWAAFGIVDHETGLIDHVIEMQSQRGLQFTGLAVIQPIQRNVPTLSEWGLITMAAILGLFGFYAIKRKRSLA